VNAMRFGGAGSRADAGHIQRRKFPPEGQRRRQSDADLIRTEMEKPVPRSVAEGILNAVSKLGLQQ